MNNELFLNDKIMSDNTKASGTVVEKRQVPKGPKSANTRKRDNNLRAAVGTCQKFGKVMIAGAVILFGISEICSIWRDNIERKRIKSNNEKK